jgi:sporulation integral membrane protein YlbJ
LWWNIVFPALLPFLIISELLGGFGFIRGAGVLLDPLMRLLFRLPGSGGWAVAMGSLAGGPTGAHITGQLRSAGTISRAQGERLLALSHMSSPFLMLSVIGAAFLQLPAAGTVIAVVHYTAALCAAFIMRFRWKQGHHSFPHTTKESKTSQSIWVRFVEEMHEARLQDGRSIGKLLGDAVLNSIQTLMLVGGCIIMFSVMLHALQLSMVTPVVNNFLLSIIQLAGFPNSGTPDWLPSLLELHLGAYSFSQLNLAASALVWKTALIGFALGWSGISQHLQVQSIVRHTDLRYWPFLVHRFVHGCMAFILTFVMWKPLQALMPRIEPSFLRADADKYAGTGAGRSAAEALSAWQALPGRLEQLAVVMAALVLLSGIVGFVRSRLR